MDNTRDEFAIFPIVKRECVAYPVQHASLLEVERRCFRIRDKFMRLAVDKPNSGDICR